MDTPPVDESGKGPAVDAPHPTVEPSVVTTDTAAKREDHKRARLRLTLMAAGILAVLLGSAYYWYTGGRYVSTDDAYIRAAEVSVSSDVSGFVTEVDVKEGQLVKPGEVLFRIDPRRYQYALDRAKAALANSALNIDKLKADYPAMLKNIAAQKAVIDDDQLTFDRYSTLVKNQISITKAQYDQARYTLDADKQKLASLQQQANAQLALLAGNPDIPTEQHPQYRQVKAQVDEARRQLDDTIIRAPFAGIVTRVDKLQPGLYLVAQTAGLTDQGAVGLVSTDDVWVEAEMKETDLTYVKPGDAVDITVDTYPSHPWKGSVHSISPASVADFSILPAENASGNWVKVVQRIPVKIHIDRKSGDPVLRSGMSVEVEIDTGHRRTLSDLF